jgi:hypothetical protein
MSFKEIIEDIKDYTGYDPIYHEVNLDDASKERDFELPTLPGECVNLTDKLQLKFYEDYYLVNIALDCCNKRRLFTALNAPKTYYACIKDNFHRNRLIIPFYNDEGKIESYISRKLLDSDTKAKYLLKFNSDKPLFNLHKIDPTYPYIFVFEGPIDCMFVKNGISISGVSMTEKQESVLKALFPFHEIIWVFDNFRKEGEEVVDKIKEKIKENKVFLYEGDFIDFKDLNQYCVKKNLDFISPDSIVNGSYRGLEGLMKLN